MDLKFYVSSKPQNSYAYFIFFTFLNKRRFVPLYVTNQNLKVPVGFSSLSKTLAVQTCVKTFLCIALSFEILQFEYSSCIFNSGSWFSTVSQNAFQGPEKTKVSL